VTAIPSSAPALNSDPEKKKRVGSQLLAVGREEKETNSPFRMSLRNIAGARRMEKREKDGLAEPISNCPDTVREKKVRNDPVSHWYPRLLDGANT